MFCDLVRKSHRSFKCTGDKHSFGERNATSLLLMLLKFWGISPGSPFIKTEHWFLHSQSQLQFYSQDRPQ